MRCANCGHPEVDHEGLRCLALDLKNFVDCACECPGFVAREEATDGGD